MANWVIGGISLLLFSFYDPSLIIYRIGLVNEIALSLIGLLFIANHERVLGLLFTPFRSQKLTAVYCGFWLAWALYFVFHAAIGLTSPGFAASRLIRIFFVILFFLNVRSFDNFKRYLRALVVLAVVYSATSIAFHVVTLLHAVPRATIVNIPVLELDYVDLGIFGYMWPTNYYFPMRVGDFTIFRLSSFFNESAAFAFFLEPSLLYVLFLRANSPNKLLYSAAFLVIGCGIVASTSAAGIISVLLAFVVLWLVAQEGVFKKGAVGVLAVLLAYGFFASGLGVMEDVFSSKQGTIDLEAEGLERTMGSLHGIALVLGTGYDFLKGDFYISANAFLSNLQRGGVIGLAFFAGSLLLMARLWFALGAKKLLDGRHWAAFALLPAFIHLGIKVTYEFTFIYLINFSLVFWYLNYLREQNSLPVRQG